MNSRDDVEKWKQKIRNSSMSILKDVQKLLQFLKDNDIEKLSTTSSSIASNASDLIDLIKFNVNPSTHNGSNVVETMDITKKSILSTMKTIEQLCESPENETYHSQLKSGCKAVAGNIKLINQHISVLTIDDIIKDDDDSSSESTPTKAIVEKISELTKSATNELKKLEESSVQKEKTALISHAKNLSNQCGELLQISRRYRFDKYGEDIKKNVLEVISLSKIVYNSSPDQREENISALSKNVAIAAKSLMALLECFSSETQDEETVSSSKSRTNSPKTRLERKKTKKNHEKISSKDSESKKESKSSSTDSDSYIKNNTPKTTIPDVMSPKDASKQLQKEFSSRDPEKVFKVSNQIGEGASGFVYRAIHRETKKVVAIKKMQVGVNNITATVKEIKIMKDLKSPYTLKYYGCYNKDDCIWIIMEYCDCGSLQDIIDARENEDVCLTEDQIAQIVAQVLQALEYLHSMKKIHRDIKAGNILLNSKGMAKLADFGISAQQIGDEKRTTTIGSSYWMAPETLMGGGYDSKADIWSLGITVIEMAEGIPPLIEEQPHKAAFRIVNDPPPRLSDTEMWSKEFVDFVSCCLTKNPEKRPSASQLMQHPFIVKAKDRTEAIMELLNWSQKDKKKKAKKSADIEEEMNLKVYFENNKNGHVLLVPGHATAEDVCRLSSEVFTLNKDPKLYNLYVVIEDGGKVKEKKLGPYDLPSKILATLKKKFKKGKYTTPPYKFVYK